MNRKLLVGLGIVGILVVLGLLVSFITRDELKPHLAATLEANTAIIEISQLGAKRVTKAETQQLAGNLAIVTSSDNRLLTAYWQQEHGKKLPQDQKDFKQDLDKTIAELEAITHAPTFDSRFLEVLSERLRTSAERLRSIYRQAGTAKLQELLEATYNHQSQFLDQLQKAQSSQ